MKTWLLMVPYGCPNLRCQAITWTRQSSPPPPKCICCGMLLAKPHDGEESSDQESDIEP